jgi:hypothetical protein
VYQQLNNYNDRYNYRLILDPQAADREGARFPFQVANFRELRIVVYRVRVNQIEHATHVLQEEKNDMKRGQYQQIAIINYKDVLTLIVVGPLRHLYDCKIYDEVVSVETLMKNSIQRQPDVTLDPTDVRVVRACVARMVT